MCNVEAMAPALEGCVVVCYLFVWLIQQLKFHFSGFLPAFCIQLTLAFIWPKHSNIKRRPYLYLYGHSLCHRFMLLHFLYNAYLCQNKYYQHNKLPFLEGPLSFVLQRRWVWMMAMCGIVCSADKQYYSRDWRRIIISCLLSIGSVVHNWSQRAFFFPSYFKKRM